MLTVFVGDGSSQKLRRCVFQLKAKDHVSGPTWSRLKHIFYDNFDNKYHFCNL
jgi:hypothetical protein